MKNGIEVDDKGNITYTKDGMLHREDGPAYIGGDGWRIEWWLNGQYHREDGPAIICSSLSLNFESYHKNGMRHREDGPAFVMPNGYIEYYIDDEYLTEQEFIEWKLLNFLK